MTNGHSANGATQEPIPQGSDPGLGDMLLGFGGAKTDHIRDMITTSTNVAESIPRSRISKKEAAGQLRIRSKLNLVKNHQANVEQVLWFQNAYTIAEGGQGRREAVDMIIGQVAGMFRRRGNSLGRYRTMDRGEIQA